MTAFKCKMCGGDLTLKEGESVCICEYCGSRQTVPILDNEKKAALFTRANRLRAVCEFDKASSVYENIAEEFPEEAEAYWGLVLCKYGIEYVDDPQTGRKIPTCHRSSFDNVMDDPNFEMVMEYSDVVSRSVYRAEAKEIERLRDKIMDISSKEEAYDIFICYKEKDNNGERTIDSVMAQDVYDVLTEKGYKVFFSRITLEDKLGEEYEPYIFAALNSAKVMLAFGTDYEYYNAVWVKNEWSRFLKMIENGADKTLIPCYKDIDAYDIPREFAHFQAQDMGKVGAIQDLVRGIDKIINTDKNENVNSAVYVGNNVININKDPLLKRAYIFLEDGEWDKADNYCEQVLDLDPEDSRAYVGKLLAELHVHTEEELVEQDVRFDSFNNYKKAIQFGNKTLEVDIEKFKNRLFIQGENKLINAETVEDCKKAAEIFGTISDWQDSKQKILDCAEKEQQIITLKRNAIKGTEKFFTGSFAITAQGRVLIAGKNVNERLDVERWEDIVAIKDTYNHTVGVKTDGTVVATRDNRYEQCDVQDWYGIVAVTGSPDCTIGLKADGSVVAAGKNEYGQCNVTGWKNIVAVECGLNYTAGLKADGSVLVEGENKYGYKYAQSWKNIVEIKTTSETRHLVGLKKDGTVMTVGARTHTPWDVDSWTDIVAIACYTESIIGLKSNGTVVASGNNVYGQCNVEGWQDIIAIATGPTHTLGLKTDGTVEATGNNASGQCDVSSWQNIVAIACGSALSLGVKADGTVVAAGSNDRNQIKVAETWRLFGNDMTIEKMVQQRENAQRINRLTALKAILQHEIEEAEVPSYLEKKALMDKITALETERANLGLFKGREKQKLTDKIEELQRQIPTEFQINKERQELFEKKYKAQIAELDCQIKDLTDEMTSMC